MFTQSDTCGNSSTSFVLQDGLHAITFHGFGVINLHVGILTIVHLTSVYQALGL